MSLPCNEGRVQTIQWILRGVLLLQALGLGTRYLFPQYKSESDIHGWLYLDHEFPNDATEADELKREALALRVDNVGNWAYLISAFVLFGVPLLTRLVKCGRREPFRGISPLLWQGPLLLYLIVWLSMINAAHMVRDGDLFAKWAFGEQAVRILAPLALLMLLPCPGRQVLPTARTIDAVGVLRFAAAMTFFVHGLKALYLHGPFVDLILQSGGNLLGENFSLQQQDTTWPLRLIGAVDIAVAFLLVTTRLRFVAAYMAFWGLVTAASRMTATGFGPFADPFTIGRYGEFLIRAANGGAPLAIFFFWHLSHKSPRPSARSKEPQDENDRVSQVPA